jgi:bifunctional aspartokinase / homoserine dehydrogenase 1
MTLVMKFGGTSVGSAGAIRGTAELVVRFRQEWGQVVVVASAMAGVTDLLLKGAGAALAGDASTSGEVAGILRHKHLETLSQLELTRPDREAVEAEIEQYLERLTTLCRAVLVLGELTPRALDAISGMGEQMSIRLLAAYLRHQGTAATAVDATELIVTDSHFQSATPLLGLTIEKSQARLQPLLDRGVVPVVTGFIGAAENGVTTTLGRGGSDYSAAILGQALQAHEVWIWTDVDGVMTADPRLVPAAQTIPSLNYREVAELAYYGAKVLHPKTIRPVVDENIPLRIKNTFNPEHPGSVIVPAGPGANGANGANDANGAIKAVTAIKDLGLITVEGTGMIGVPGIAARTFGAVAGSQVSVLLISQASSEQSICFAVPGDVAERVVAALEKEFAPELERRDIDSVWAQSPVTIIMAVGAGMRGTPGIAGQIFSALGEGRVNVIAIAQGSSECGISMVVDGADTNAAVGRIHELIVGSVR